MDPEGGVQVPSPPPPRSVNVSCTILKCIASVRSDNFVDPGLAPGDPGPPDSEIWRPQRTI